MKIGIISFQGAIREHANAVEKAMNNLNIDGDIVKVEKKHHIEKIDGLIIPGGESTTIAKLMKNSGIFNIVKEKGNKDFPILGTCAGLILLANSGSDEIKKTNQSLLELMDIIVERNAFGRQKESFETKLKISSFGKEPFPCVFIRAPAILEAGNNVGILGKYKGKIVAAEQENILTLAFHPELTQDTRAHEYFLQKVGSRTGEV